MKLEGKVPLLEEEEMERRQASTPEGDQSVGRKSFIQMLQERTSFFLWHIARYSAHTSTE